MSEVWKNIFRDWIKSYESIEYLEKQGFIDDIRAEQIKEDLLIDIINTCISEVEDEEQNK